MRVLGFYRHLNHTTRHYVGLKGYRFYNGSKASSSSVSHSGSLQKKGDEVENHTYTIRHLPVSIQTP